MNLKQLSLYLIIFYFSILCEVTTNPVCPGNDWVPYKDEKCVKLIKLYSSRDQAEQTCNGIDSYIPTLVTIKSADEQLFLNEYVYDYSEVKVNIWIGAERIGNDSQFVWDDGSAIKYSNWAQGSPSDVIGKDCVAMQSKLARPYSNNNNNSNLSEGNINGKWKDVTCELGNWFLCQKLQTLTVIQLQKKFFDSRKEIQDNLDDVTKQLRIHESTISSQQLIIDYLKQNPVPIGFIYVQLPSQPDPRTLWSTLQWQDVTSTYAGLFFRAEGGQSAPFDQIQEANSPRLTRLQRYYDGSGGEDVTLTPGYWAKYLMATVDSSAWRTMGLYVSNSEVRPRNMAMRIWKRTY